MPEGFWASGLFTLAAAHRAARRMNAAFRCVLPGPGGDFSAGVLESKPVTFRRPERVARGAANPNSAGLLIPKNLNTAALLFMGNSDG
ncbi:MAG: hypothetical protein ABSA69_07700 [Verrucomicrobiota bacterium]|jgi:hypothetical protein